MFSRAREDTVFVSSEHTERNNSGEVTSRFLTLCWWCHFSCFHHLQTLSRISFTLPITHLDFLLENAFSWKEPKIVSNQNPRRKTTDVEKKSMFTGGHENNRHWGWEELKAGMRWHNHNHRLSTEHRSNVRTSLRQVNEVQTKFVFWSCPQ